MNISIVVEYFSLLADEVSEELVWVDGDESALIRYLAERAVPGSHMRFRTHLDETRHLATEIARWLRDCWNSRDDVQRYPAGTPLAVRSVSEIPRLPRGVPVIFAVTGPPRNDELAVLKRYAQSRYTESKILLPACHPSLLLEVIRREGIASWTRMDLDVTPS